ncbi:hypothetical protein B0A49_10864 [Cryomyces minteri]|uniref:DUF7924 domain-containing protein n=1 Tax=Cryomyces minteri TaxID=331657 RepID=A0A4U0X2S7_9PEZI|nr:hypothetical protein B0A49_10864 [Cryomyces minteri]
MALKRKRADSDVEDDDDDRAPTPLTEAALSLWNSTMPRAADADALSAPPSARTTTASSATASNAPERLDACRIYRERSLAMPEPLAGLLQTVSAVREGPATPQSKRVAALNPTTKTMSELDAIVTLIDVFLYRPGMLPDEEETWAWRTLDSLWNEHCVPIPSAQDDATLQRALDAVGCPKKPKPDVTYGYAETSFTRPEKDAILTMPPRTRVLIGQPYLPFLVVEWKSDKSGGTVHHAILQAARDGAAAVNTAHKFYDTAGKVNPTEHETAIFSCCVSSRTAELHVHWRRDDVDEGVSWEMDKIYDARLSHEVDVFAFRSMVLNILDWARTTRLACVKAALSEYTKALETERAAAPRRPSKSQGLPTPSVSDAVGPASPASHSTAPHSTAPDSSRPPAKRRRQGPKSAASTSP